jgi:hypothetical protein
MHSLLAAIAFGLVSHGAGEWRYVVPPEGEAFHAPLESPLLLSDAVPEGLEVHVQAQGPGFAFAQIRYGDPGSPRVAIALDRPKEGGLVLYVDANNDRALEPEERLEGHGPSWELSLSAWAEDGKQVERVPHRVSIRVGRTGLLLGYATLGYLEGEVEIGGKPRAARRVDADGNGFFTDARDRLWIDLDGDGRWSAFDEQFLYAPVLRLGDTRYALHSDRLGRALGVEKIEGVGHVRFRLPAADGTPRKDVLGLQATLIGKDGSSVGVRGHDEPVEAPIGEYRIGALALSLAAPGGAEPWTYVFSEPGGRETLAWHALARDGELVLDPIGKLDFRVEVKSDEPRPKPGDALSARIWLFSGDGLLINSCYRGTSDGAWRGTGPRAFCRLLGSSGAVLEQADSGFA